MENKQYDIIIVGGGIVGLATAYKLNVKYPDKKILVLEKEKQVAAHQTGHNSGVIHSGLYYKPASYKAKNCVDGRRELVAFAKEHKISHDICGKVVVATNISELAHMNNVFNNGIANGVEGVEKIDANRISQRFPARRCKRGCPPRLRQKEERFRPSRHKAWFDRRSSSQSHRQT